MDFALFRQLFSIRDVRNAVLGFVVLFGGLGLAGLTYYAHLTSQARLAGIAAGVSLVFVLLILIFVVPPLARSASREASQLNLPFELTPGGAVMLVLVAIVGFSAWNTANNLLFLVLSFMTAAMIVGFFAGSVCLKRLEVKMRFPETIFAGEETAILVNLSNKKKLFPSYSVVAEVRGREREESIVANELRRLLPSFIAKRLSKAPTVRRTLDYFVHVPRNEERETKTVHVFSKRGRFLIKDFELSTKFPFGFFRHRRRLPARETELVVFPGLTPLDNQLSDIPTGAGKIVANRRGSGQDLLALRDYRPNDDLRRVDWKATGRTDRLTVREFSDEDDKRVTIILDTRCEDDARDKGRTLRDRLEAEQMGESSVVSERFERGVSIAASLVAHFADEQAEIRLYIDGELTEFGLGSRHLHALFKKLAVVEPTPIDPGDAGSHLTKLADDLEEADNSHNFLITALPKEAIPTEIARKSTVISL
jgi:uncharacterized protein (DUF58 family)